MDDVGGIIPAGSPDRALLTNVSNQWDLQIQSVEKLTGRRYGR